MCKVRRLEAIDRVDDFARSAFNPQRHLNCTTTVGRCRAMCVCVCVCVQVTLGIKGTPEDILDMTT